MSGRFAPSGAAEAAAEAAAKRGPTRTEEEWRPTSLLCKRFGVRTHACMLVCLYACCETRLPSVAKGSCELRTGLLFRKSLRGVTPH
eukprot:827477-Prorocentrum_minimum.AAC.1